MFFYRIIKRVEKKKKKKEWRGWNSLEVQWLGLCAFTGFTDMAEIQSLVGEQRPYKLCSAAKKINK